MRRTKQAIVFELECVLTSGELSPLRRAYMARVRSGSQAARLRELRDFAPELRVCIAYLPAYEIDCGWDGPKCLVLFWQCKPHAGDSEVEGSRSRRAFQTSRAPRSGQPSRMSQSYVADDREHPCTRPGMSCADLELTTWCRRRRHRDKQAGLGGDLRGPHPLRDCHRPTKHRAGGRLVPTSMD